MFHLKSIALLLAIACTNCFAAQSDSEIANLFAERERETIFLKEIEKQPYTHWTKSGIPYRAIISPFNFDYEKKIWDPENVKVSVKVTNMYGGVITDSKNKSINLRFYKLPIGLQHAIFEAYNLPKGRYRFYIPSRLLGTSSSRTETTKYSTVIADIELAN